MCVRITLVEVSPKYLKIEELVEGVYNIQEIREWSRERKTGRVGSESENRDWAAHLPTGHWIVHYQPEDG